MPKNQSTAAQKARRLQAATGAVYTDILKEISAPVGQAPPASAAGWLRSILEPLQQLGWPASPLELDHGRYHAYCGPVVLDVARDADDADADGPGADPDEPRWADRPLYLGAMAPHEATVDDFGSAARAGAEPPSAIAVRLDAELAAARWTRVQGVEPESTTPCPICGDRYPGQHLLANSPEAAPCCPSCIWDQDQPYRADLPHLAVQIDRLFYSDLAVPAGWAAVAAVIALSCGANLGRRLERELRRRHGFPFVMPWWDQPMERSWIWLPPKEARHPAFARLGAGASLASITDALERHDPTLRPRARQLCREAEVRWRESLWPAAVAMAAAFTTQCAERDRHRRPVHVVDSTGDGLSQIREPFAVSGDATNIEGGLEELLAHLLFPLLLGHGMRDAPHEPQRVYGAADDDQRPARSRADASIRHETDRAAQVAVVLGKIPGMPDSEVIWDGATVSGHPSPLGSTAPVNAEVEKVRQAARIQVAEEMFDAAGPIAMVADEAWTRAGWWIPADDAGHALRQARDYLAHRPQVEVLWADEGGNLAEPMWVGVDVLEVNAHGTGADDLPWLRVSERGTGFGMRIRDIAVLRRVGPDAPAPSAAAAQSSAGAGPEAVHSVDPSAEQAWRMVGHNIHRLAHHHPGLWQYLDHLASRCREQLWTLPTLNGQDVTVEMWLRLTDTETACEDPRCRARGTYLTSDGTGRSPASGPLPAFAREGGLAYFTFTTHPHGADGWTTSKDPSACTWMYTVLALHGGFMRVSWLDFSTPDSVTTGFAGWEVRDYRVTELRRVAITNGPGGTSEEEAGDPGFDWPPLPPEVAAER